jgi:uncharacterized protein (TIGR02246 family)
MKQIVDPFDFARGQVVYESSLPPAVAELQLVRPMKTALFSLIALMLMGEALAQTASEENRVREVVRSFYADFNSHVWTHAVNYTTEDWTHINPLGGWTRGRDAVLKELEEVHSTFLKGVSDTIKEMDVRFASRNVAVVTVTSQMSTFTTPDGTMHENEQHIRTFALVRHNEQWMIMHDQNTAVARPKA